MRNQRLDIQIATSLLIAGFLAFCEIATVASAADIPAETPLSAFDRQHWSFEPLQRPDVPKVNDVTWCRTPVDRFLLARLEDEGLHPMPEADRLTLLRRVTVDLTGLPPTPDEIDAFLSDEMPHAYERVVDRLMASPSYGERWAQHWLDLARFAESDGFEFDHVRPQAWRYRDWVIEALNEDLPYDRFVAWQLAGDELEPQNTDANIATGYLLCGPDMPDINLQQERRHTFLNDMTANVAEVLLGLRMGCAQCHDHRTDPISQFDFYRLRAFFEPLALFKDHPLPICECPDQEPLTARIAHNQDEETVESHLWIRGDFRRPGPTVEPAFPRVVDVSYETGADDHATRPTNVDRSSLAAWLIREDNPLTARVIVNRLWQHHFGEGLAATPSDFGIMGDSPTHPELLDWLATELMRQDWSLKGIHRLLVTSSAYRTSSRPISTNDSHWSGLVEADPDNDLLGRMRRRRLEGESLRDAMLSVAGQLNREQRGPGVRPPLAPEVTATLLRNQWPVTEDAGDHTRRSVYLFVRRNLRYPLFDVFDKPDPNQSCPKRSETTIAPQALHLMNSDFAVTCAEQFAERVAKSESDRTSRIAHCYRLAFGRPPTEGEQAAATAFLDRGDEQTALLDFCLALLNTNEFLYVD